VYFDTAGMVLVLFTLGRYLEAQGRVRAARSLAPMLAAERAEVRIVRSGVQALCPVVDLQPGDLVRVLPGERIAVDGVVVEGQSECEEAVLTGQPEPRPKAAGAPVHAGSQNGRGVLRVRATVPGTQTRWVRIGPLVRDALAEKSLMGDTVDRVAAVFIPGVLLLALATAWFWSERAGVEQALLAGLSVLVVACPCSLGLAAPLASALAIGEAAQRGILIRSGAVLERLARLKAVAFDKTDADPATLRPVSAGARCNAAEVLHRPARLRAAATNSIAQAWRMCVTDAAMAAEIRCAPARAWSGASTRDALRDGLARLHDGASLDGARGAVAAAVRLREHADRLARAGARPRCTGCRAGARCGSSDRRDAPAPPRHAAAQRRRAARRGATRGVAGHRRVARRADSGGQGAGAAQMARPPRADGDGWRRTERRSGVAAASVGTQPCDRPRRERRCRRRALGSAACRGRWRADHTRRSAPTWPGSRTTPSRSRWPRRAAVTGDRRGVTAASAWSSRRLVARSRGAHAAGRATRSWRERQPASQYMRRRLWLAWSLAWPCLRRQPQRAARELERPAGLWATSRSPTTRSGLHAESLRGRWTFVCSATHSAPRPAPPSRQRTAPPHRRHRGAEYDARVSYRSTCGAFDRAAARLRAAVRRQLSAPPAPAPRWRPGRTWAPRCDAARTDRWCSWDRRRCGAVSASPMPLRRRTTWTRDRK
jgi:hypothetical protein